MKEETKDVVVTEGTNALQHNLTAETVEVVKQTVFPSSTDAQLKLYLHKCVSVGVHPLDGMIHPAVFNTKDGARVVFTSSIDFHRSRANDTDNYDGQDDVQFGPVIDAHVGGKNMKVPEWAKVTVFKKDSQRGTSGTAYWEEFVPAMESKQMMWAKMPRTMLAKCAEAQALRKAFPKALHGVYAEEEMHQAANKALNPNDDVSNIGKPKTFAPTAKKITGGQVKRIYALAKKSKVKVDAVKASLKARNIESLSDIPMGDMYEKLCDTIENNPAAFDKYNEPPKQEPQPEQHNSAFDAEEFAKMVRDGSSNVGYKNDGEFIDALKRDLGIEVKSLVDIPADKQSVILDKLDAESM